MFTLYAHPLCPTPPPLFARLKLVQVVIGLRPDSPSCEEARAVGFTEVRPVSFCLTCSLNRQLEQAA